MIESIKRRSSIGRISERRNDFVTVLNRIICENRDATARQSINPLQPEPKVFRIIMDDTVTSECLTALLKHVYREVAVIGVILPHSLLSKCVRALIGRCESQLEPLVLQGSLGKSLSTGSAILYLLIDEQSCMLDAKPELQQKLLYHLSMIWITTDSYARKRTHHWETREELFRKNSSLLVIKEEQAALSEEFGARLENCFWNVAFFNSEDLCVQAKRDNFLSVKPVAYRQAYQNLSEQVQSFELRGVVEQLLGVSVKRNWKFSRGLLCYPLLYFISGWMKEEQRQPKQLVEISLNWYFKCLEEQFAVFLKKFELPIDELKLRNAVGMEKRGVLLDLRRHLGMFEGLFVKWQVTARYGDNLGRVFSQREGQLYQRNNKLATEYNEDLLGRLYEDIISKKFEESTHSERNIKDYQTDFQTLLDLYGSKSIRVKSQLKTFNEFIMSKKVEYAENLGKELRGKKKYSNEKEELKDRLEIQMGVLETLEEEIKELEEKREKIDHENQVLKDTIGEIRQKRAKDMSSDSPSSGRKKNGQSLETRSFRKETKLLTKAQKGAANQRRGCCCCVLM